MTILLCSKCDWIGQSYSAKALSSEDISKLASLAPGSRLPWGKCPYCDAIIEFNHTRAGDGYGSVVFHWDSNREERPNLTQFQKDALFVAIANITPEHPAFRASDDVKEALAGPLRLYIDSWVRPVLVATLYGETYPGQRDWVCNEARVDRAKFTAALATKLNAELAEKGGGRDRA
ncbi:hypothetical protein PLUTO_00410 [Luteibacter phage vB_LflM-Pluto]|uniref:Uncharacterized protein n=1 Tax=Luteibacter phage vB_LflM-Pluto TaxID=2948611 RepID=A0A9E7MV42_9CAUD|nr:hypothetical protein PLUTO_00410 [Luteibacter phage vB_LflM-Pluto]